eukprot:jgi/Bigna1/126155/aug1.2_g863
MTSIQTSKAQRSSGVIKRVLVFGGTGRVGGSTIEWLQKMAVEEGFELEIAVAGRNRGRFDALQRSIDAQEDLGGRRYNPLSFLELDFRDSTALQQIFLPRKSASPPSSSPRSSSSPSEQAWDLVIHTAGPFQQKKENEVLSACLEAGIAYVDVCDDTELALSAKRNGDSIAKEKDESGGDDNDNDNDNENGIPVLISTGIWPGVSALMANKAVRAMERKEGAKPTQIDMNFFTAGTGGAGATILSATFLLLCEPVRVMDGGRQRTKPPWSSNKNVDFGPHVGIKPTYLLDQPEVIMCGESLDVPNVESRFGTAPGMWNELFKAIAVLPASLLSNRDLMQKFAVFSLPIVQIVDALVGSTNAMRVDAVLEKVPEEGGEPEQRRVSSLVVHESLSSCVGQATAAFAIEVLRGRVQNGVHFPVELNNENVDNILARVKKGALTWQIP